MEIYRKLVYSNIENFLLACFPVLYNVLGKRRWEWLVHRFIARHRSQSPYFRQIPEEFIQFLQGVDALPARYPEFAVELAHYEWVELALSVSAEAADWERIDQEGGLLLAHGGHHIQQIQQLQDRDYDAEAATWKEMKNHVYRIADATADALAKQFSGRF